MKRLMQSANFWNAIIATILLGVACKIGCGDMVDYIFFLFAGKTAVSGIKDYVRSKNGVEYCNEDKKFKKVE